ncbi:MAG: hypothetical protein TREMPRED_001702 [Tremellales sp. Tagirdzhanova-0007]|nr:MAG: hypothetical protein TREMPRED_001702 [Tremellales sp. Tagirdzhanova-0007]
MEPVVQNDSHRQPDRSLLSHWMMYIKFMFLKVMINAFIAVMGYIRPPPPSVYPTLIVDDPSGPGLRHRIFVPRSHQPGHIHPVYFSVHASGWFYGSPAIDDEWCTTLADKFNYCVISLDHPKCPAATFPEHVRSLERSILHILQTHTHSLPVDPEHIAVGGFSSGATLALGVAQFTSLRDKIKACVAWSPVIDWSEPIADKAVTRPYRNPKDSDVLIATGSIDIFRWAYLDVGQDLFDPMLDPRFAARDTLPKWIFIIAAEYDVLGSEARDFALNLMKVEENKDNRYECETGSVKWKMIRGVEHGFTHRALQKGDEEIQRAKIAHSTMDEMADWLNKGAFLGSG